MVNVLAGLYVLIVFGVFMTAANVVTSRTEWRVNPNYPPDEPYDVYYAQARSVGRLWTVRGWHNVGIPMSYQLARDVVDSLNAKERGRA